VEVDVGLGFREDVAVEGRERLGRLAVRLRRGIVYEHCVDEGGHAGLESLVGSTSECVLLV
jgi:hypothetical protein